MAGWTVSVLSLYAGNLSLLTTARCLPGQAHWCTGAYTGYETVRAHNHTGASGVYGAVRFAQAPRWTARVSLRVPHNTRLVWGYDTTGENRPGMGGMTVIRVPRRGPASTLRCPAPFCGRR